MWEVITETLGEEITSSQFQGEERQEGWSACPMNTLTVIVVIITTAAENSLHVLMIHVLSMPSTPF